MPKVPSAAVLLAPSLIYVDAGAIVALFAGEARGQGVRDWLDEGSLPSLVSADWCMTEVASALSLKVRTRQLSAELADAAWRISIRPATG